MVATTVEDWVGLLAVLSVRKLVSRSASHLASKQVWHLALQRDTWLVARSAAQGIWLASWKVETRTAMSLGAKMVWSMEEWLIAMKDDMSAQQWERRWAALKEDVLGRKWVDLYNVNAM